MSTPTIEQIVSAQERAHDSIKWGTGETPPHLLTPDELRRVLVENEELKRKVENQRERIVYLEGATSHACGTPLSIMRSHRDQWRECARELARLLDIPVRTDGHDWPDLNDEIKPALARFDALAREEKQ